MSAASIALRARSTFTFVPAFILILTLHCYVPAVAHSLVTPIADIQADPQAFLNQVVTVEGQVYIPSHYRSPTFSGYIQDGSGRGINLFGMTTNDPILQDVRNVVRVTGPVSMFFTTVEITNLTEITLLSSNNPPLVPQQLSTGAAASSAWEGTYIEVTAPVLAATTTISGTNYTVNDGTGNVVVRVVSTLGVPTFSIGTMITARGAGSQFQTDYQILVGRSVDVFEHLVPVEGRTWSATKQVFK